MGISFLNKGEDSLSLDRYLRGLSQSINELVEGRGLLEELGGEVDWVKVLKGKNWSRIVALGDDVMFDMFGDAMAYFLEEGLDKAVEVYERKGGSVPLKGLISKTFWFYIGDRVKEFYNHREESIDEGRGEDGDEGWDIEDFSLVSGEEKVWGEQLEELWQEKLEEKYGSWEYGEGWAKDWQVLGLLLEGYRIKEIAEEMGVDPGTVQWRTRRLEGALLEVNEDLKDNYDNRLDRLIKRFKKVVAASGGVWLVRLCRFMGVRGGDMGLYFVGSPQLSESTNVKDLKRYVSSNNIVMISAERGEFDKEKNRGRNLALADSINAYGYDYYSVKGYWKEKDDSVWGEETGFFVVGGEVKRDTDFIRKFLHLGQKYKQSSVLIAMLPPFEDMPSVAWYWNSDGTFERQGVFTDGNVEALIKKWFEEKGRAGYSEIKGKKFVFASKKRVSHKKGVYGVKSYVSLGLNRYKAGGDRKVEALLADYDAWIEELKEQYGH